MSVDINYVGMNENLRGMTASDWLAEWVQWLHGVSVDYRGRPGEILHTRGGLSYSYVAGAQGGRRVQLEQNKKNIEEVYITDSVPIYVNVLTSFYFVDENHPTGKLDTLNEAMAACKDDFRRSQVIQADIGPYDENNQPNQDLNQTPLEYRYVEAFDINVKVHPNSLLADEFEMPVEKGVDLRGCAVGYISLIKSLPKGSYILRTHNKGVRGYGSESEYKIKVQDDNGLNGFTDVRFMMENSKILNNNNMPTTIRPTTARPTTKRLSTKR